MLAWFIWEASGLPSVGHEVRQVAGLPVCRVTLRGRDGPLLRWLTRRECGRLRRAGIRQGIWPAALPCGMRPELHPVEIYTLRRALMPQLIGQAARQKGICLPQAAVRLTADGAELSVYYAARLLAERARYLQLDVGLGQQALEQWLWQRYGLSCGGEEAVMEVSFRRGRAGDALLLGQDSRRQQVEYLTPPDLQIPEGEDREPLLAALFAAGRVKKAEIQVKSVQFDA